MKALVFLAEGFEEIEAVTIIDVLRRAQVETVTAHLSGTPVVGAHGISIEADTAIDQITPEDFGAVILPGGMPGSGNLRESDAVLSIIKEIERAGGYVGAICAAPIVLAGAGLSGGKNITCYPGFEKELDGARYIPEPVMVDGRIITGKGPGCAIPFALKLVELLSGKNKAEELREAMQVYWM